MEGLAPYIQLEDEQNEVTLNQFLSLTTCKSTEVPENSGSVQGLANSTTLLTNFPAAISAITANGVPLETRNEQNSHESINSTMNSFKQQENQIHSVVTDMFPAQSKKDVEVQAVPTHTTAFNDAAEKTSDCLENCAPLEVVPNNPMLIQNDEQECRMQQQQQQQLETASDVVVKMSLINGEEAKQQQMLTEQTKDVKSQIQQSAASKIAVADNKDQENAKQVHESLVQVESKQEQVDQQCALPVQDKMIQSRANTEQSNESQQQQQQQQQLQQMTSDLIKEVNQNINVSPEPNELHLTETDAVNKVSLLNGQQNVNENACDCKKHETVVLSPINAVQPTEKQSSDGALTKENVLYTASHQQESEQREQQTSSNCSENGRKVVPQSFSIEQPIKEKPTGMTAAASVKTHLVSQSELYPTQQYRKQCYGSIPITPSAKRRRRINHFVTEHTSPFPVIRSTKQHDGPKSPRLQQSPMLDQLQRSPTYASCAEVKSSLDKSCAAKLVFPPARSEQFQPSVPENDFDLSDSFTMDNNDAEQSTLSASVVPRIPSQSAEHGSVVASSTASAALLVAHSSPKKPVIPGLYKLISKVSSKVKCVSSESAAQSVSTVVTDNNISSCTVPEILPNSASMQQQASSTQASTLGSSVVENQSVSQVVNKQVSLETQTASDFVPFESTNNATLTVTEIAHKSTDNIALSVNVDFPEKHGEKPFTVSSEGLLGSASSVPQEKSLKSDIISHALCAPPPILSEPTTPPALNKEVPPEQQAPAFISRMETQDSHSPSVSPSRVLNSIEAAHAESNSLAIKNVSEMQPVDTEATVSEPNKSCKVAETTHQHSSDGDAEKNVSDAASSPHADKQISQDESSSLINPPEQIDEENDISACLDVPFLSGKTQSIIVIDDDTPSPRPPQSHEDDHDDVVISEVPTNETVENSSGLLPENVHKPVVIPGDHCASPSSSSIRSSLCLSPISRDSSVHARAETLQSVTVPSEVPVSLAETSPASCPMAPPLQPESEKLSSETVEEVKHDDKERLSNVSTIAEKEINVTFPSIIPKGSLMEGFNEFLRKSTSKRQRPGTLQESTEEDNELQAKIATVLSALQTGKSPALVNRDDYLRQIREFVLHQLDSQSGQVLYISGVPGTGKTLTVKYALAELQREALQKFDDYKKSTAIANGAQHCELRPSFVNSIGNPFKFFSAVYINALSLFNPNALFETLVTKLKIHRPGLNTKNSMACRAELQKYFTTFPELRFYFVLVIDEADFLFGDNDVLYNLVNLPVQNNSKLSIIFIANHPVPTMETSGKVRSRLGVNAINFDFYNKDDLQKIVCTHLENVHGRELFSDEGIKICCTRLATFSGDARKALDIVRSALQLAEFEFLEKSRKKREDANKAAKVGTVASASESRANVSANLNGFVTTEHFDRALKNFTENTQVNFIRSLPPLGKLIVELFRKCKKSSLSSYVLFGDIYLELAARLPYDDTVLLSKAIAMLERLREGNVFRILKTSKDSRVVSQSAFYQSSSAGDTLPPRFWRIQQNTVDVILAQVADK